MKFFYLEETDSTNKYAKEHIEELFDKEVVYTYNQTAGRGRINRKWSYAGCDNIYASIVLKPSEHMQDVYSNLTQYLALIISNTIEEYGVFPQIKWPNDIRVKGKKISGILAEAVSEGDGKLKGLVLGFGVNLNTTKEFLAKIDQPATSLNLEIDKKIDKEEFLKKVTDRFCLLYNNFIETGFLYIRGENIKRAEFINKEISVKVLDTIYTGVAIDITENGALKIVDKEKKEHTLLIGDIL